MDPPRNSIIIITPTPISRRAAGRERNLLLWGDSVTRHAHARQGGGAAGGHLENEAQIAIWSRLYIMHEPEEPVNAPHKIYILMQLAADIPL